MALISWYWNTLKGLISWVFSAVEMTPSPALLNIIAAIATFIALSMVWTAAKKYYRRLTPLFRKPRAEYFGDYVGQRVPEDQGFTNTLEASRNFAATAARLKHARDWRGLAEAYAAVNRHKEAARYFSKAKDRHAAAAQWAKAGKTVKAAKQLLRLNEFLAAGRLFEEAGKFRQAAQAFEQANDLAQAATVYAKDGRVAEAVAAFGAYFANTSEPVEKQFRSAEACLALLESDVGKAKISGEQRRELYPVLADRYERTNQTEQAARLYVRAGMLSRAGDLLVKAGRLEDAARTLREAGDLKGAHRVLGRHYEGLVKWREAGEAYLAGSSHKKAGEMFNKAGEHSRAGECYSKAKEHFLAGLSFAHASRFRDAILHLQEVKESDGNFDAARALLGRCFYELHDFARCAAALENHLTGKRVDSSNVELFYMLASAYEQLGKLDASREVFYKIQTINVRYKDVTQRISNISSRIMMQDEGAQLTPRPSGAGQGGAAAQDLDLTRQMDAVATKMMESVENALDGRYVLEKELGRGGMGVVYLARDVQLDRPVALKFIGSAIDDNEEFRQRFIREAQTAAKINHPNIIAVYEISSKQGKAYIAMEFVEGGSLQRYLQQKGTLTARETVNLISQACSALGAVHEAGIVHRDIKPDNILIAKGGLVKLMDFGLAKSESNRMTRTGMVMGTPSYMSPEQVLGKDVDARSDIYAIGLVMYECLTGATAFRNGNVMERQLSELPPVPSSLAEGVPPKLDAIVMKCVQKQPEDRWQTMQELTGALRAYKE